MMRTRSIVWFIVAYISAGLFIIFVNGSGSCEHDKFDCKRWAKKGFCKTMKSWMEDNCCQACKDIQMSSGTDCIYLESTCEMWAKQNFCTDGVYKAFMKENCCKTCQDYHPKPHTHPVPKKSTKSTTEKRRCVDDKDFCTKWRQLGYCTGKYEEFMKKHCCKTCGGLVPTTIPLPTEKATTIPMPTEKPLPTKKPSCTDDMHFCGKWAELGWCKGMHQVYMKKHCCKTCAGVSRTQPPPKPTKLPPTCVDDNKNCDSWAKTGECKKNKDYMKLHCCKSCSKKPDCTDDEELCKTWAESGECKANPGFMLAHCRKSCQVC